MKALIAASVALLIFFAVQTAFAGQDKKLKIVTGTSLIEDIVLDLTEGEAETLTIIKGSSCPGHETVRTTDFVFAAHADLVLIHSFQKDMAQIVNMLESAEKKGRELIVIESQGSWVVPENQKQATLDIAKALSGFSPDKAAFYKARSAKRLARIERAGGEAAEKLKACEGKAVIAADMQAEFVTWAGCLVAETYSRAENMGPRQVAFLADAARGKEIVGIIDNYQSGSDAGLPLALELKVPHVVLSNFPGSSDDAPDYFGLLRHNTEQLLLLAR